MISIKDLVAHVAGQENPMLSSDALVTGVAEAARGIVNKNDRDLFVKDLINNVAALRAALVHVPGTGAAPVGVAPPVPPPPPPVDTARTENGSPMAPALMDPHQRLEELGQMWDAMKQRLDALSSLVEKYIPLNGAPEPAVTGGTGVDGEQQAPQPNGPVA
jgi:hypothetical protein